LDYVNDIDNKEFKMKTMTCNQLGGACEKHFRANTFEEIAQLSKQHGMEMFQQNDQEHLAAMAKMKALMQQPQQMTDWFESKRAAFNALPDET
jgi:predicted small metal-binding protein